ncbi:MAG: hypothetical protein GX147_03320 [Deltaproteobacteria bacterium]|jgi:uncharacterized protein YprB with RNaseH-like and TPR domain|nr:hypothetical protein [Deltaproteobacteria bacterium]
MTLQDRLRRLTGEGPATTQDNRDKILTDLRRRIEAVTTGRERRLQGGSTPNQKRLLEELLPGEERENEYGRFYSVEAALKPSHRHGNQCVADFLSVDMDALSVLADKTDLAGMDAREGLYLDTETTGLSGGTGTVAFLIGLGWFEETTFVTRQLFVRDYPEERACLAYLSELAQEKGFLVTFNGKSFDVNLLGARFIMNRLPDPLTELPHLDLLHPTRRLLGHRLENNRLGTVEQHVLGLDRGEDIPGWEIPERYFRWLRNRHPGAMLEVFRHNHLDVVSLSALARHLAEIVAGNGERLREREEDHLAAARLLIDRTRQRQGKRRLRDLCASGHPQVSREARRHLSLHLKRDEDWKGAIALWEEMLAADPADCFACEELAKWYEHRDRNPEQALCLVCNTLELISGRHSDEQDRLTYRRIRLERKCGKP